MVLVQWFQPLSQWKVEGPRASSQSHTSSSSMALSLCSTKLFFFLSPKQRQRTGHSRTQPSPGIGVQHPCVMTFNVCTTLVFSLHATSIDRNRYPRSLTRLMWVLEFHRLVDFLHIGPVSRKTKTLRMVSEDNCSTET